MTARRCLVGLGCLTVAVGGGGLARQDAPKNYALLVGIDRYSHAEFDPLAFAEADVTAAAEVFRTAGYEVEVVPGNRATLAALRAGLKGLAKKGGGGGAVVVGFAGHGLQPDGGAEAYYCPYDAGKHVVTRDGKRVDDWNPDTLLPLTEVLAHLRACPAGAKLVLADCCRNDPKSGRGRGVGAGLQVGDLPENTAVLLSCSRGQRAYEDKAWGGGHGAFFQSVIEALGGEGSNDGKVTADSLWQHVSRVVPGRVAATIGGGAEQRPARLIVGDVDLRITGGPAERAEAFEYVFEGEPKRGTRRVVVLDIGGGQQLEFVRVPKGSFAMGAADREEDSGDDERPRRRVELTRDFYLGKFEVTQAQYLAVTGRSPSKFRGEGLPVEQVSWADAVAFCEAVSRRSKRAVGLPSEAEWEYACRAGTTTPFHFGGRLNGDLANCDGNEPYGTKNKGAHKESTVRVDYYKPNAIGIHNMHGNVREWCADYYAAYPAAGVERDPVRLAKAGADARVLRGGSWNSTARACRAAYRLWLPEGARNGETGFRVALR